jgi:hypothetical protein
MHVGAALVLACILAHKGGADLFMQEAALQAKTAPILLKVVADFGWGLHGDKGKWRPRCTISRMRRPRVVVWTFMFRQEYTGPRDRW